jgi:CheY-like chemotaxis protein
MDKIIGEKLRKIRELRKFTRDIVATKLNISSALLQQYESAKTKIPISNFLKLCKIYLINYEDFIAEIEKESEALSKEKKPSDQLNIVLIEDNVIDQIVFRESIESSNNKASINAFQDSRQGLDFIYQEHKYLDLIFLDLNLANSSGHDILKKIKTNSKTMHIPTIIISSSALDDDIHRSYSLGSNGYIVKSIDKNKFKADIKQTISYWKLNSLSKSA